MMADYHYEPLRTKVAEIFGEDLAAEMITIKDDAMFEKTYIVNEEEL